MEVLALEKDGGTSANSGVFDVVIEGMNVEGFDCRISKLITEPRGQSGEIEERVRDIDIIPAAKQFGCSPANPTKGGPRSNIRETAFYSAANYDRTESPNLVTGVLSS